MTTYMMILFIDHHNKNDVGERLIACWLNILILGNFKKKKHFSLFWLFIVIDNW